MRKITIPKPRNDSLPAQLLSLYEIFRNVSPSEELEFDLSRLIWISPFLILPISAYINDTKSKFIIDDFSKIKPYLDTINFPEGVDSVSSFRRMIQEDKNYIPISILKRESGADRERLESLFATMVYKTLGAVGGTQNAIYYPIGELITNIFEHSRQDTGFVFAQFYPRKEFLDTCIVDRGRGLRIAYQQDRKLHFSDEDAIIQAMSGTSIKDDRERGYGIRSSKKIVCQGLGGEFILLSGSAALVSVQGKERLVSLPDFNWQGVIVAYRIPVPKEPIDISPFVE